MNKVVNEKYAEYVHECWKWAENLSIDLGITDNELVILLFNKICKPFHYWLRDNSQ